MHPAGSELLLELGPMPENLPLVMDKAKPKATNHLMLDRMIVTVKNLLVGGMRL